MEYVYLLDYMVGCSLFNKFELNFMAIQSWSWFTELGSYLQRKVVQGIEKRSPRSEIFRVNRWHNYISFFFLIFFLFSSSIFIIYWIIQYFHILSQNFHLEICALSNDFGVKMIEFAFTPQVISAGGFLHKGMQILKLLFFLIQ